MVRAVTVDKVPVTAAAAAFGYSRPSYYQAAAALERSGLEGLVPARPGPRGAHKLTAEILAWAEQALAADPALRPAALAGPIEANFGVRAHPRSIERALARHRERHSQKPVTYPPAHRERRSISRGVGRATLLSEPWMRFSAHTGAGHLFRQRSGAWSFSD